MKTAAALLVLSLATIYLLPATINAQTRAEVVKERVEARKEAVETRREAVASKTAEVKAKLAESKEAFLERRLKFASEAALRKETLKTQLKAIKDRKKANVAERLDTNLAKINENRTTNMLKHLDQMDSLIDKVEGRIATASGLQTAEVTAAIEAARESVDTARASVQEQATQSYPVSITSEATIKIEFQEARDNLLADLKAVHQEVIEARKTVNSIFEVIAKARGLTDGK